MEGKVVQQMPKISIVMPSLNVAKYIRQCIESVLNQTLKEIEVICVDAGSTDGTLEILQEYADTDDRVQIIQADRKSYGYQMNLGFAAAKGEYLGVVETDDFAEPDMFEKLYSCAKEYDLDVAKAGFYLYWSTPTERNEPYYVASHVTALRTFCPSEDFKVPLEQIEFFNVRNSIWSAIYRHSFVLENQIRFTETPGASFQDTSFALKAWCTAKRVRLLEDCVLHYRQDNENSSINSAGKIFCICDEYEEMWRYLNERPSLKYKIMPVIVRIQYDAYMWNLNRLHASEEAQHQFIERFREEFAQHESSGTLNRQYYETYRWENIQVLLENPSDFFKKAICTRYRIPYTRIKPPVKRDAVKIAERKRQKAAEEAAVKSKSRVLIGLWRIKHGLAKKIKRIFKKSGGR